MFSISAISITIIFALIVIGLPFFRKNWATRYFNALKKFMLNRSTQVYFYKFERDEKLQLLWLRIWGITASSVFVILSIVNGKIFLDRPLSIIMTIGFVALSAAISAILVITALSYLRFFPMLCGINSLRRSGIQGAWTVNSKKQPDKLQDIISTKIATSSFLGIIDVTGHSILGKGSGSSETILYNAIAASTNVPVYLLLLDPQARTVDHERSRLTIAQEALRDMEITESMFRRKLRATIEVAHDLNEEKPAKAKIDVLFYHEKPTISAIIFDDAAFVSPWNPKETESVYTLFQAKSSKNDISLFEIYRHHFTRLWANSRPMQTDIELFLRKGSSVVRKKKVEAKIGQ